MKLVVGLGNPGARYARTPHNVGFEVLDALAGRCDAAFRKRWRFRARTADVVVGGRAVLLAKPQTFMNASGDAVAALARYHRLAAAEMLVVLDDADLPLGRLRVRPGGGSGGHRGLASILARVEGEVARVRIGVGRREAVETLVDHVLTPWRGEAWEQAKRSVARAADAVMCAVEEGVEAAMNRFNGAGMDETASDDTTQADGGKAE